ncbi:uncharacterized protein TNCV_3038801 [Trichonephila clavipes]|nr:uncharacterized protein TNCV_3038801 [Trichonephila clavipes]
MHWRHRFPMLFIKLSDTGIGSEDQTQSKPCFSSCNDLGGGFKAATSLPRYSQKMFYRIQVWRSSWPFHSFQTVILQILLNNPSSVRSCIIIHQNEVVTNSSSIWADIWIKGLIPISKTSYGSSMEHMQVSVATERDPCPNQDSTTSITVPFNSVGLMVSSALFPPDQ